MVDFIEQLSERKNEQPRADEGAAEGEAIETTPKEPEEGAGELEREDDAGEDTPQEGEAQDEEGAGEAAEGEGEEGEGEGEGVETEEAERREYRGIVDGKPVVWNLTEKELIAELQKSKASTQRFNQAKELKDHATAFANAFFQVDQEVGGIPGPADAMIRLYSQATKGDMEKAADIFFERVAFPFVQKRLEEEGLPEAERRSLRLERQANQWRAQAEKEKKEREALERQSRINRRKNEIVGIWSEVLSEEGLDEQEDVRQAQSVLVDYIENERELSREDLKKLAKELRSRREEVRRSALVSLSPADLLREHPELAKRIIEEQQKVVGTQTTEAGAMPQGVVKHPSGPTKPQKRPGRRKTRKFADSYEEFFDRQ